MGATPITMAQIDEAVDTRNVVQKRPGQTADTSANAQD